MKMNTATIADVERALSEFKTKVANDSKLEGLAAKKLAIAVNALTPKSTVSGVFKRLQRNALRDFAVNKEQGNVGYSDETKNDKMKEYVTSRFRSYMDDPKTSTEATRLFNAAYPAKNNHDTEDEAA